MALRAKVRRSTPKRRTVTVAAAKSARRASGRAPVPARLRKIDFRPKSSQGTGLTYAKALRFLNTLSDYERLRIVRYNSTNFDLDRMRTLLRKLGNPHEHFRSVHVAGTKGKGSTCAMVASMLQANGYKTGLYTSPHLTDIRERI